MARHQRDPGNTFEDFIHEHGARLLRTAVLLAHDEQAGQDLLQDALERLYRAWLQRPIEFPSAYTRTVMVRLLNQRRPRHHPTPVQLDGYDRATEDHGTLAVERLVLFDALSQLAPRRRAAVVLRHWEGYSESETAAILGCSIGTVKSQTHRGLQQLRESCELDFPDRIAGSRPAVVTPAPHHPGALS